MGKVLGIFVILLGFGLMFSKFFGFDISFLRIASGSEISVGLIMVVLDRNYNFVLET